MQPSLSRNIQTYFLINNEIDIQIIPTFTAYFEHPAKINTSQSQLVTGSF